MTAKKRTQRTPVFIFIFLFLIACECLGNPVDSRLALTAHEIFSPSPAPTGRPL
jgi:hypothetical protein